MGARGERGFVSAHCKLHFKSQVLSKKPWRSSPAFKIERKESIQVEALHVVKSYVSVQRYFMTVCVRFMNTMMMMTMGMIMKMIICKKSHTHTIRCTTMWWYYPLHRVRQMPSSFFFLTVSNSLSSSSEESIQSVYQECVCILWSYGP